MSKPKPVMDWPAVVAELHRNGMTLTELARRNDLNPSVFRQVKTRTNYKAQTIIAEFIGQKPEKLWPGRYPKGGPRILDTKKYPPMASQKGTDKPDKADAA
ncbi:helix-turn-helix domain-containing protein [Thalassovita sp.]|uniref:helix-turn-helix domain-containing protein n=1 Tax=Thalassovita sp. TaxID=1979401 RepID=UPI002B2694D5|nr:helix-turn-helix domain-containing protein [Thalassovita sp.]